MFLYFKTVVVDISRDYDDDSNHDNDIDNYGGGDCKLPARKPSPKRRVVAKAADSGEDFNARTVHQVLGHMTDGSPVSQKAALGVLENLSSSSNNVSKTLVKSAIDQGNISVGMSQEIAKTLLRAEKLRASA